MTTTTTTASRTYPHGVPSWIDLEPADASTARDFYGQLFDWTFTDVPGGAYTIIQSDGLDVGGFGRRGDTGDDTTGWNTYVAVDDADAAAAAVTAAGGTVVDGPRVVGPAGRWVIVDDPSGARFRLWEAGRRLGSQATNVSGTWVFSNLRTPAPESFGFYADVFGWKSTPLGDATLLHLPGYADHLVATTDPDLYERQAPYNPPPGFADAVAWLESSDGAPYWNAALSTPDRDASAALVEQLGGTVGATTDTSLTKTADVRDPEGNAFTLSQFLA